MNKYNQYVELLKETTKKVFNDKDSFFDFLKTSATNYKYKVDDQILIYAQRPETKAVETFKTLTDPNRMNRRIKDGANGIALVDKNTKKLHYVFAAEDSVAKNEASIDPISSLWKLEDEAFSFLQQRIETAYNINTSSVEEALIAASVKCVETKIVDKSHEITKKMSEMGYKLTSELSDQIYNFVSISTAYAVCLRCGFDISEKINHDILNEIQSLNSETLRTLYSISNVVIQTVLRSVEANIIIFNKQKGYDNNDRTEQFSENKSRKWDSIYVRSGNENLSSVLRTESGDSGDRRLGTGEREVSEEEQRTGVRFPVGIGGDDSVSSVDKRTGVHDAVQTDGRDGESGWSDRGHEGHRSDEMGRSPEHVQASGEGNSKEGTDRSINDDQPSEKAVSEDNSDAAFTISGEGINIKKIVERQSHDIFNAFQKLFPDIISMKNSYEKYVVDNGIYEPLSIDILDFTDSTMEVSIAHHYIQNGDVMSDPDIVLHVDFEKKTANSVEYTLSIPPVYERYERASKGQVDVNSFMIQWLENLSKKNLVLEKSVRNEYYKEPEQNDIPKTEYVQTSMFDEKTVAAEIPNLDNTVHVGQELAGKFERLYIMDFSSPNHIKPAEFNADMTDISYYVLKSDWNKYISDFLETYDYKNNPPTITCNYSESSVFEGGKTYSVFEFDSLMAAADKEHVQGKEEVIKRTGKDLIGIKEEEWKYIGYDKTSFNLNIDGLGSFEARQDIGDGFGGVIDFLSTIDNFSLLVPMLREAAEFEYAKILIDDYCNIEFDEDADFSNLQKIGVAFTNLTDDEIPIQVDIDLINYSVTQTLEMVEVSKVKYDSLKELIEHELKYLDFSDLIYVSDKSWEKYHSENKKIDNISEMKIYQIKHGEEYYYKKFENLERNKGKVNIDDYDLIYTDSINNYSGNTEDEKLDSIFRKFNADRPSDFKGHSLSVSDVIVIGNTAHYIDDFGFKDFPEFFMAKEIEQENKQDEAKQLMAAEEKIAVLEEIQSDAKDFVLSDDAQTTGGAKTKFKFNIEAIQTLKNIEAENRSATPDEQNILARYCGWGGIPQAFDELNDKWTKEYSQLKELLTEQEYKAARATTTDSFYTAPFVVDAMYDAFKINNFKSGTILEPSMGIGTFFSLMPEEIRNNSKLYGVEIDDLTGRIAKQLHPNADIKITGFEKTQFKNDFFDIAIGNVPFGSTKLNEKEYNQYNFHIHDHFFAKSLDKVRPGGIVAFVTSQGTLDKKDNSVRKYLAERADLVGAVRLPSGAFNTTDVTSDIIFLQKRETVPETEPSWVNVVDDKNGIPINAYFAEHPEMVLGQMVIGNKLYGNEGTMCVPFENSDIKELLKNAVKNISFSIPERTVSKESAYVNSDVPENEKMFSYFVKDDVLYYYDNIGVQKIEGKNCDRIKEMVSVRDAVRDVIDVQLNNGTDEEVQQKQFILNERYDAFVGKYGYITSKYNHSTFDKDISQPLIESLEKVKDDKIIKAEIFSIRTIRQTEEVTHVDTAKEALAIAMAKTATVDFEVMEQLTGFEKEKIISELRGVIYENPITEKFEMADEYLSGNIRDKIKQCEQVDQERYADNIAALQAVMPIALTASEIDVKLGATWIDPKYIHEFIFEELKASDFLFNTVRVEYDKFTSTWGITNKKADRENSIINMQYGTEHKNAYSLIEDTLNLKPIKIMDYIEVDGKTRSVLNSEETQIAQDKQKELQKRFKDWVFRDKDRRDDLVNTYNVLFNSTRAREYDGSYLEFPEMNANIHLRKHQLDAIAHVLYGKNTLFAHEVGAGKTFEIIASAMEGKRLGLHHKSLIVVPGHLTEQMGADFLRLYPNANILVASSKDFEKKNRQKLFAKITTGNFDAIIIGHSQLTKIPVSKETQVKIVQKQVDELEAALKKARKERASLTIKQLEAQLKKLELKLKMLLAAPVRDDFIDFESLGVDKMFVDEAHLFKNLMIVTKMGNISGLSTNDDVQKTVDLYTKCQYLDEITGGKGVVFATGTPVSNSISEIYTMMKYLQSDMLKETGLSFFDAWAANFAETVTESQLLPEGNGYQMKTRFANFNNLPELMQLFKECADIKTVDMLNLAVPECEDITVVAKPTELQKSMIKNLGDRADKIRKGHIDRHLDNMVMITNDGRSIGLDIRLIDPMLPDSPGTKINMCVDNVFNIWEETKDNLSTQLIFSDIGVPHDNDKKRFCVYDDIKKKLIEKGIPADEIKFIHDAKNESSKEKLFSDVRSGKVRVLIGSTSKMGAGTNVQDRMIALHNLDAPWKPADLEQRRGRIVRQGNTNEKVKVFKYITEGTFDAYLYQILENKQRFISQIMTSKTPVRSCQDIDDATLSMAEAKALAAGDPHIKERMDLEIEISKLKMLKANHQSSQYALQDQIASLPEKIAKAEKHVVDIESDIFKYKENPLKRDEKGERIFEGMTINGVFYDDKKEAVDKLTDAIIASAKFGTNKETAIAEYKGFTITAKYDFTQNMFFGSIKGAASHRIEYSKSETGNLIRIENLLEKMDDELKMAKTYVADQKHQLETAKVEVNKEFPHEHELEEKSQRLEELVELLEKKSKDVRMDDSEVEEEREVYVSNLRR